MRVAEIKRDWAFHLISFLPPLNISGLHIESIGGGPSHLNHITMSRFIDLELVYWSVFLWDRKHWTIIKEPTIGSLILIKCTAISFSSQCKWDDWKIKMWHCIRSSVLLCFPLTHWNHYFDNWDSLLNNRHKHWKAPHDIIEKSYSKGGHYYV